MRSVKPVPVSLEIKMYWCMGSDLIYLSILYLKWTPMYPYWVSLHY